MNRILVLKDKYGDTYYDASTDEKLHAAALHVVRSRFGPDSSGDYWFERNPKEPKIPFTDEQLAAVPEALKEEAKKKCDAYLRAKKEYLEQAKFAKAVERCLANNDGKLAYAILNHRADHEYEGISLEEVQEIT